MKQTEKQNKPGVFARVFAGINERRLKKLSAWLENGDDNIPLKLIGKIDARKAMLAILNSYMANQNPKHIQAAIGLGDEGVKELRKICREKHGAVRAFAINLLGHIGTPEDFRFLNELYFLDKNKVVKVQALASLQTLIERFPEAEEIETSREMVMDSIARQSKSSE